MSTAEIVHKAWKGIRLGTLADLVDTCEIQGASVVSEGSKQTFAFDDGSKVVVEWDTGKTHVEEY